MLKINVRALGDLTDREDAQVPGIYEVTFGDFDTSGLTIEKQASMALDVFHSNVSIGTLDEFEIRVLDANDKVVSEDPSHEGYDYDGPGNVCKIAEVALDVEGIDAGLSATDPGNKGDAVVEQESANAPRRPKGP